MASAAAYFAPDVVIRLPSSSYNPINNLTYAIFLAVVWMLGRRGAA